MHFLAVDFDPKTGISEGLMLFSILSGDFWFWGWEKNSAGNFLMFTWEAERGSIKAGGSINESSIKAGATVNISQHTHQTERIAVGKCNTSHHSFLENRWYSADCSPD